MPINHSPKYAPDEAALEVGSRAMLQVALDCRKGGGRKGGHPEELRGGSKAAGARAGR